MQKDLKFWCLLDKQHEAAIELATSKYSEFREKSENGFREKFMMDVKVLDGPEGRKLDPENHNKLVAILADYFRENGAAFDEFDIAVNQILDVVEKSAKA